MTDYEIPSHLSQVGIVSKYEFLKMWKRRRITMSLILSIAIPLIIAIIVPFLVILIHDYRYFGDSFPVLISTVMSTLPMFFIIIPLILATDSLSTEYQNETGLVLFVQPVNKGIIFLGKYLTYFILNIFFIFISYLTTFISGFFFFNPLIVLDVIYPLFLSFIVAITFSTAYLSIICFLNTVINRTLFTAAVMVFLGLILTQVMVPVPLSPALPPYYEYTDWFIPYFNLPFICQMLITVDTFESFVGFMFWPDPHLTISFAVAAFYIIAPFLFTIFWEQRKTLK